MWLEVLLVATREAEAPNLYLQVSDNTLADKLDHHTHKRVNH